jgi:hypothetical protein
MKFILFLGFFFLALLSDHYIFAYDHLRTSNLNKNMQNGPIASSKRPNYQDPMNLYPDYRFSQSKIQETETVATSNQATIENGETAGGGDDKPVFTLNIHAPQESTDDIIGF